MKSIQMKTHNLEAVLHMVREELSKAWVKHPGQFHNAHEGWAVLREEVDELWDEVKADTAYTAAGMKEAIQVAAMAVRFIVELHDHPKGTRTDCLVFPSADRCAPDYEHGALYMYDGATNKFDRTTATLRAEGEYDPESQTWTPAQTEVSTPESARLFESQVSDSRVSELLDYATSYGAFNEYTLNGDGHEYCDRPMDAERRNTILCLKTELLARGWTLAQIVERHSQDIG